MKCWSQTFQSLFSIHNSITFITILLFSLFYDMKGFFPDIWHSMNEIDNTPMTSQNSLDNTNDMQRTEGNKTSSEERHSYQHCNCVYPLRTNLSPHIFPFHHVPSKRKLLNSSSKGFKGAVCYEKGCNMKFKSTTDLRNHLVNVHNFIFQIVRNQLETDQQFLTWKKKVEETCNIKWVMQSAKTKPCGNLVVTYICHRSGKFENNSMKEWTLRSFKIGHFCTAYLKVIIFDKLNENGKKYSVELYPDHYGHDVSPSEEKETKIQIAKCLTNPVRGILISTAGVLFENGKHEAIEGSIRAVEKLRKLGIAIRFLTNDSLRTPADLCKKLQDLGFKIFEEEIISPIPIIINTLSTLGLRPYLIVHPDIISAFDELDQSSPNCVVIGNLENNFSFDMFNKAYQVLISSPSPVLLKLGNEKYNKERNEFVLGPASYAASLEYACSTDAIIVGKPCYGFIMDTVDGMGISSEEVIMVGDDIENDIQAAQRCGIRAVLVQTGKFRPDDAMNQIITPDTIVKNLAHLVDMLVLKSEKEKCSAKSILTKHLCKNTINEVK